MARKKARVCPSCGSTEIEIDGEDWRCTECNYTRALGEQTEEYRDGFDRVVVWSSERVHYVFRGDASEYPEPNCTSCGRKLDDPAFRVLDVLARAEGHPAICPACVKAKKLPGGRYGRNEPP